MRIKITEPTQLIVEGKSDEVFFKMLLCEINVAEVQVQDSVSEGKERALLRALRTALDIASGNKASASQDLCTALRTFSEEMGLAVTQVHDFRGKDQLPSFLKALKAAPDFAKVKSLGIVRDADDDHDPFQSVCTALTNAGLPTPKLPGVFVEENLRIGVFILPDNKTAGMLETLCLRSVADDPVMPCIEEYFECIQEQLPSEELPKAMEKAKVQAFLASRDESELLLGQAAHRGHWPWEHPVFDQVKQFLREL